VQEVAPTVAFGRTGSAYRPGAQGWQAGAPSKLENSPSLQIEHVLEPKAPWKVPLGQLSHFLIPSVKFVNSDIFPIAHGMQFTRPSESENFPDSQLEHSLVPSEAAFLPAKQRLQTVLMLLL